MVRGKVVVRVPDGETVGVNVGKPVGRVVGLTVDVEMGPGVPELTEVAVRTVVGTGVV